MAQIIPVAKKILICDDVIIDSAAGKTSILNVWNGIRVRPDELPYALRQVCIFAEFRGGLGDIPVHVELVQVLTGRVLRKSNTFSLPFKDRLTTFRTKIGLEDVVFPMAGSYLVELYCGGEFVDDQPIQVRLTTS